MNAVIRRYEVRYDVVSPEELAQQLDVGETEGWGDLTAWRTTWQNLAVTPSHTRVRQGQPPPRCMSNDDRAGEFGTIYLRTLQRVRTHECRQP